MHEPHSLKQGYPWPNLQPTPTSLSLQTKQASSSTQIPPDLETPPKPTKCMIPNGSHGPKQGDPWKIFSRSPPQRYFRPSKTLPQLRLLQTPKHPQTPQNAWPLMGTTASNKGIPRKISRPTPLFLYYSQKRHTNIPRAPQS